MARTARVVVENFPHRIVQRDTSNALEQLQQDFDIELDRLRERGLWRQLSVVDEVRGTEVRIAGR